MTDSTLILDTLKRELSKPGRSQAGLARAIGLDASAVSRMLRGQREIKARELAAIEEYFNSTDTSGKPRPTGKRSVVLDSSSDVGGNVDASLRFHRIITDYNDHDFVSFFYSVLFLYAHKEVREYLKLSSEELDVLFPPNSERDCFVRLSLVAKGIGLIGDETSRQFRVLAEMGHLVRQNPAVTFDEPDLRALATDFLRGQSEVDRSDSRETVRLKLQLILTSLVLAMYGALIQVDGLLNAAARVSMDKSQQNP